ncbi:MAG: hypothetical protein WB988_20050 [Candidatus Nitrosopolaris sp.]|jgi:hypothetical protein
MKLRSESLSQGDLVKISKLCALDWELERQILNIKGIEIWNVISNLSRQTPRGLRIT